MRFFISWHPDPPDIKYWEWFDIDGIIISLASLQGRSFKQSIEMGIHRFCGFDGDIIIDSGGLNLKRRKRTQTETFHLQRWLGADFAVHLDRPYVKNSRDESHKDMLEETLRNARTAKLLQDEYDNVSVIYVVQGWNTSSYQYCTEKLVELGVYYYGVGSLIGKSSNDIVRITKLVRGIIGKSAKLHLFGVSGFKTIQLLRGQIDSFDSSTAVKAGFLKEYFASSFVRLNVNTSSDPISCDCPVCRENYGSITLVGLKGRRKLHNMLRAVHNAHVITSFARLIEKQVS